ncbi:hypothetical protein AAG570_011101 [Ranatra chinensis]|uniref:Uncharacterized protein n=1 Tax=Ranatra chinensis TaxID=642074 RepID=A0ABD0YJW9_9HEMI
MREWRQKLDAAPEGFLEANLKCFWDGSLVAAVRGLEYKGYVSPGVLLVSGNPCALEVLRTAYSRNLLKPPANYAITLVEMSHWTSMFYPRASHQSIIAEDGVRVPKYVRI